jgi:transcriptional regulator with XRE-family HTH domain
MWRENSEFARLLELTGWSHARAAKELFVDPATISRIVNQKQRVGMTMLRLLAELSGDSMRLPGITVGSRGISESATQYRPEPQESELLRIFKQLPKERRDALLQNARFLLPVVVPEPKPEPNRAATGGVKSANFAAFASEVPDIQQNEEPLAELPLVPEPTGKWAKAYGPHQPPKYIPPPSGAPPPMRYATGKPSEKKDKPQ